MWSLACGVASWAFSDGKLFAFYAESLRSDFFNGFLSLAGFMLAAKTFIVIHMKEEVYDKPEYAKLFDARKELVGQKAATRYGPLRRMSDALYWIVFSSVAAALAQLTIGLIPWNLSALICILSVLTAVACLLYGMHLMKKNLDRWFELVNAAEQSRLSARREDSDG